MSHDPPPPADPTDRSADGPPGPRLARRARVRWDASRSAHVLLAPESVLVLTATAAEVLALCDGTRSRDAVVAEVAARYPAGAPVARDVDALFDRLRARGLLE